MRPKFLNLLKIRLPLTGIVSILHRVSGVLLVIAIPVSLYWLQASLISPGGYQFAMEWIKSPLGVTSTLAGLAALLYHLFSGLRFLLVDAGMPMNKQRARWSAGVVIVATIVAVAALLGRVS
ncbi:MAG: succinate dehydrogenase, cytochrome b556 subunit [Gammaproteobacteria bacterium]|nr:succinate dehydrogenase, cytochrome b556 subunit [Gammaproteobacteria bacterium]